MSLKVFIATEREEEEERDGGFLDGMAPSLLLLQRHEWEMHALRYTKGGKVPDMKAFAGKHQIFFRLYFSRPDVLFLLWPSNRKNERRSGGLRGKSRTS